MTDTKPCSLIAIIPPALHAPWGSAFSDYILRFRPASLVLLPPFGEAGRLIEAANEAHIAVLLRDNEDAARQLGAAGIVLDGESNAVRTARTMLGNAAIVGAFSKPARHDAMEIAEAGADFLVFDATDTSRDAAVFALASWWDELTQIPFAIRADSGRARHVLSFANPDFLMLEESGNAGESLDRAIDLGLRSEV